MSFPERITGKDVGYYLTDNVSRLIDAGVAHLGPVEKLNGSLDLVLVQVKIDLINLMPILDGWVRVNKNLVDRSNAPSLCTYLGCLIKGDCTAIIGIDHCGKTLNSGQGVHYFRPRVKESIFAVFYRSYHGIKETN